MSFGGRGYIPSTRSYGIAEQEADLDFPPAYRYAFLQSLICAWLGQSSNVSQYRQDIIDAVLLHVLHFLSPMLAEIALCSKVFRLPSRVRGKDDWYQAKFEQRG